MSAPAAGAPADTLERVSGDGVAADSRPQAGVLLAVGGWPVARDWQWRRLGTPLALIVLIIVAGIVLAYLQPRNVRTNSYLDPASNSQIGTQALADILGERGISVTAVYSTADALAAVGTTGQPSATLVITAPDLLPARQLAMLARAKADLFLVGPQASALNVLAPTVSVESLNAGASGPVPPGCSLPAAQLAGSAELGGISYGVSRAATGCYLVNNFATLVRYAAAGKTITILGSGVPLTNADLADAGNAALALNLLSVHDRVVWLTPQPALSVSPPPGGTTSRQGPVLIPWAAWLVVLQLAVAVLLAAIWRGRRLGPLIAERLPVVVRASETVEGHARLYQARRARARAAQALREAMVARLLPALGLPKGADAGAVTQALADRSRLGEQAITAIVYGPQPATDAELVSLTRKLDDLEREVRSQ